jgi:hypothetical protein
MCYHGRAWYKGLQVWRTEARKVLITALKDMILISSPALHRCLPTRNVDKLLGGTWIFHGRAAAREGRGMVATGSGPDWPRVFAD